MRSLISAAPHLEDAGPVNVLDYLAEKFPGFAPEEGFLAADREYPAFAPAEYLDLIARPDYSDPIFAQIAPSGAELDDGGSQDPAQETDHLRAPGLLHRYPDRVLLLVTNSCLVRCRHCMRKRLWAEPFTADDKIISGWSAYISAHPEIEEIILSGGDPLSLSDHRLNRILSSLPAGKKLRVHTRAVAAFPSRVTPALAALFSRHRVSRLITQFNHPAELTPSALRAASLLSSRGISVENQSVLLKGVNDSPAILSQLFLLLSQHRIRPYYLHHPDPARGTMHFYLSMEEGWKIFKEAAESSITPTYVVDLPGAVSKWPVLEILNKRD